MNQPNKPARYFIAGVHGDHVGGPDGVEICLTRAAVEDLLGWHKRFKGLGLEAVSLHVENPASVQLRWLTGAPLKGHEFLLDELARSGEPEVCCNCPCAWSDTPWTHYETAEEPAGVRLEISGNYVRWVGHWEAEPLNKWQTTQGITTLILRAMLEALKAREVAS